MKQHKRRSSGRWSSDQIAAVLLVLMRWQTRASQQERLVYERTWQRWREFDDLRKGEVGQAKLAALKTVSLRLLERKPPNHRSDSDCKVIGKWLQTLACVPKMDNRSLIELASTVEMFRCPTNTLIILQGEFGNCYYMIAFGAVALYVEDNRDKELTNFRDYAQHRGDLLPVSQEALGRYVLTLPEGKGFGELAVIETTHKIRSATAVSVEESCLLIVQGPRYLSTIHPFSKIQSRVGAAINLLRQHPISKTLSFANIAALAYEMQKRTRQHRQIIVRTGQEVSSLYFIEDGFVKAHDGHGVGASLLGRGCIIGESELYGQQSEYALSYVTETTVDLFELPLAMYRKIMKRAYRLAPGEVQAAMKPLNARQVRIEKGRAQIESLTPRKPEPREHRTRAHTIASIVPFLRFPQRPSTPNQTARSRNSPRTPHTPLAKRPTQYHHKASPRKLSTTR